MNYKTREEAIQAAIEYAKKHGPIEFDGQNCNDYLEDGEPECGGWDGQDLRCECGNRRVSWTLDQDASGNWHAYACAY